MPGDADLYIRARTLLLDVIGVLAAHRDALILVGAHAVYMHTERTALAVAEFTTDADLSFDPALLEPAPLVATQMESAGFKRGDQPGQWIGDLGHVDLMVAEAVGGSGRRGADLGEHGRVVARQARGLEGALVDKLPMIIKGLGDDRREESLNVAGSGALLVAKSHKICEREATARENSKDALDVYRLLASCDTSMLGVSFEAMAQDERSREAAAEGLAKFRDLFSKEGAPGLRMIAEATEGIADTAAIVEGARILALRLLDRTDRIGKRESLTSARESSSGEQQN